MSKKKRNHERPDDQEESECQDVGAAAALEHYEDVLDSVMYEVPRNLSLILEGNVKINEEWSGVDQLKLQLEEDSPCDISHLNRMAALLINISQVYDEKLAYVDHIISCIDGLAEVRRQGQQPDVLHLEAQAQKLEQGAAPTSKSQEATTASEHKMMLRRREEHSNHHHYTALSASFNSHYSDTKRRRKDSKYDVDDTPHSKSYLTRSKYDKLRRQMSGSSPRRCTASPDRGQYSENETPTRSINLSEHSDQDGDGEESDEPVHTASSRTKIEAEPVLLYCICRKNLPEAAMVACDNQHCEIEWFHFKCVDLKVEPKGKWYCPGCRINKNTYNKPRPKLKRK